MDSGSAQSSQQQQQQQSKKDTPRKQSEGGNRSNRNKGGQRAKTDGGDGAASNTNNTGHTRNRGRGGNKENSHAKKSDKDKAGAADHQDKKQGDKDPSAASTRPPKTIAATETVDLHPEGGIKESVAPKEVDPNAEQHQCFICTENIVIFAVSDCNHRTCHLCSLRLRALYKTKNCAYCKADQTIMIFTRDPEKAFQDYDVKQMAYFDRKLNIYFEDQEMYEDTMVLLRFNCPDPTCEVYCPDGWNQLKSHVKKVHKLLLCDLCVRYKKVFAHEHNLMTSSQLIKHFKTGDAGLANQNSDEPSGFKGHPECGFCRESFFGDDELFDHCKKNHEQCFLCLRRNVRHQYYDKYLDLENHFQTEHFACQDPECLEKKFVVFDSDLDLRAHEAETHPNSMNRNRRRIDVQFGYAGEGGSNRRGAGGGSGGGGSDRRRGGRHRDSAEHAAPQQQPQLTPHQIQQIATQREMELAQQRKQAAEDAAAAAAAAPTSAAQEGISNLSIQDASSGNRHQSMLRTRPPPGFGSSLSEPVAIVAPTPTVASRVAAGHGSTPRSGSPAAQGSSDWPSIAAAAASPQQSALRPSVAAVASQNRSSTPVTTDTLNKHAALQDRVQQYLKGTTHSLSQFRQLTTQYRNTQIPANQYVASLASLFFNDMDKTGKVIQGVHEVLDSEAKKTELLRNWHDYKAVQNQFPSLETTVIASSPSQPATMARVASPSTRRVLVIKSSGTTRGNLGHAAKPKSTSMWDRAAAAATSMNRPGSPARGSGGGSGGVTAPTPVFYPTPQLNSGSAWANAGSTSGSSELPVFKGAKPSTSSVPAAAAAAATSSSGTGSASWGSIHQDNHPTATFRPSTSGSSVPSYSRGGKGINGGALEEHFPTLVSNAAAPGARPSLGLIAVQRSKSNNPGLDDLNNGWVMGWDKLTPGAEEEELETTGGKKKKNKKKILFHVG
ncbi:hypothetical protein DFQ27_000262 [Actinomortierella ambigua]|uniref:RING-type E3 ubiquitin transferase n=1 Tax=Actinomortierella ambigua TaxID=1343610 RepID=A0A9P6QD36_9FUNG|nr:hypothetical protein DFQ27_000262 [Actinomortierella ambigua]